MLLAIFGINNSGLNLVVNLLVFFLVVIWLALIVWTYFDARRRIEDPVLVSCATAASIIPYVGTFVYTILRPPDFLEDARERDLEIKAAELRVRQLSELSCANCGFPVEKNYLRCPNCQRRLKDPCQKCGKPVDPRWALCPYCETALPGRARQPQRARAGGPGAAARPGRAAPAREKQVAQRKGGGRAGSAQAKPEERPGGARAEERPSPQRGGGQSARASEPRG